MAKDHFACIGAYRKALDEIAHLKKELWFMLLNPSTTNLEKVQIITELHLLTKTYILLLRDLPFISNLAKYYDLEFSDPNYKKASESSNSEENKNNDNNEDLIEQKVSERPDKIVNESGLFIGIANKIDTHQPTNANKNIDENVMKNMQGQLNGGIDYLDNLFDSKEYKESLKFIKEIKEE